MPHLNIFNFPKYKFAIGILCSTEGSFDKQT